MATGGCFKHQVPWISSPPDMCNCRLHGRVAASFWSPKRPAAVCSGGIAGEVTSPRPARITIGRAVPLPAQNAIGGPDQPRDRAALNLFHSRDQPRGGNASLGQIVGNGVERNLLGDDRLDVTDHIWTLHRPRPEAESFCVLPRDRIVDRVAAEQDRDIRSAILHRVGEPDGRVVLLLDRGTVRAVDDAQIFCHGSPHSVPIRRTPSDASLYFHASTGEPRQTPSTWFSTPRSSTHIPQLHQTSFTLLSRANASSDFTHSLGFGWSSSSSERPCTALACGFWPAKPSAVAPS